jgi:hypothetical protein
MLELNFGLSWNYKGKRGGAALFGTAIDSFQAELRDWAPAFRQIAAEVFAPFVERQFESGGAEGGSGSGDVPWQELASGRRAGGARTSQASLLRTGRMAA